MAACGPAPPRVPPYSGPYHVYPCDSRWRDPCLCSIQIGDPPAFSTELGSLFEVIVPSFAAVRDACVNTVFADPPFNLGKEYGASVNDRRTDAEYLDWCRQMAGRMLPDRSSRRGDLRLQHPSLEYRAGALSGCARDAVPALDRGEPQVRPADPRPALSGTLQLALLHKGKPKTFRRIRTPIETCRHCGGELKDYGGHRDAMNEIGVNLMDVWTDVPPVRHGKFKSSKHKANALLDEDPRSRGGDDDPSRARWCSTRSGAAGRPMRSASGRTADGSASRSPRPMSSSSD